MQPTNLLDALAMRIGENRIIAGLHYLQDHVIGYAIGRWIFNALLGSLLPATPFKKLLAEATREMANQWAPAP